MELYNVPRNSKIRVIDGKIQTPIASTPINEDEILEFSHVDGMYSYCKNNKGEIVHLAAWTEVEIVENK
jgi:hypothetical protein